ncbi:AfsR/SARP family transcriptional regulator [Glycomyces harbinensis]|uniref:DNA-binding transcriptional activator of the SARP family n=1 Tax=Glycomyces harbinensis TaxID=58114 RepID=A0A1G6R3Y0_9ACTN|nr:BTAD domain-containing putative transcriptional regulator [Glycomyces harbinensis]SDC99340.1 DNA-binding transcriptional activator of the SARP family [Glycomyces harbinensis]
MRFAILGPLRVSVPGEPEAALDDRRRRVLGMLLLAEERPVPTEVLRRVLWGETRPLGADERIEKLVRDLEHWLPDDLLCEFQRIGSSHRLKVRRDQVDVEVFRREVRDARVRLEYGEDAEAVDLLDKALRLWRGRPLDGLTGPDIDAGAAKLMEFKAEVDETRFEALLRLGRFATLIGEGRQAIRERPFDQEATRRLMAALAEAGRDSEAKQVFEELQARLAERSGDRPVREVRDLYDRIGGGDRPPPSQSRQGPTEPRQLTSTAGEFTGRTGPLRRMDRSRLRRASGVVISGIGGLGKTSLGLAWAERKVKDFPDGQLFADLRGASAERPAEPLAVLHGFMRALGFPASALAADLGQAGADFRAYAAGRRLLVFLDNALDADQVRPLLPGVGDGFTIVTARAKMPELGDLDALELEEMDAEESEELLLRLAGAAPSAERSATLAPLIRRCGGLPLALRIASDLLGDTDQPAGTLTDPTGRADDDRADLWAVFDLSYRHLSEAERRLHLALAPLPGPSIGPDLALSVARRIGDDPQALLDGLVRAHWLRRVGDRYETHNLVAAYAADRAERELSAAERRLTRDRVVAHFHLLGAAVALEDFEFLTAAYEAWQAEPNTSRLANALCAFAQRGHRLPELVRLGERAAASATDPVDLARHCNLVAVAAFAQGDLEHAVAYGRRCVAALESTPGGDRPGTARANLGGALALLERYDEALPVLEAALAAAETCGAWDGAVTTSLSLARVHQGLGDFRAAEARLLAARALDRDRSHGLRATMIDTHLDDVRRQRDGNRDGAAP